jgi:hypothetical protein
VPLRSSGNDAESIDNVLPGSDSPSAGGRRASTRAFAYLAALLAGCVTLVGCVNLTRPQVSDLGDGGPPEVRPETRPDHPVVTDSADAMPDVPSPPDGVPDLQVDVGLANGHGCLGGKECDSGVCVDGVCCASACTATCSACNVAGSEGTCTPIAAGEDPSDECPMEAMSTCGSDGTCDGAGACRKYPVGTQCQPPACSGVMETPASSCDATGICKAEPAHACSGGGMCQGTSCASACTADTGCQTGFFCDLQGPAGVCRAKLGPGAACVRKGQCQSQYCVDGVCCGTPCTENCSMCNLAGSLGTCKPVPAGQDPRNVCSQDLGNSCGFDGTCNGAGACRQPSGTACGSASCTNGAESLVGSCNGVGTCTPGPARDCGAYACAGTACGTSCTSDASCMPGYACASGACTALPGPVLYWKLDESNGTTAFDASPFGNHGTYTSAIAGLIPTPSTSLPPLAFANASSRAFVRSRRDSISLLDAPASAKPTLEITLSAWYRSSSGAPATGEEEVLSIGDNVNIRVRTGSLELAKRTSEGHKQCWLFTNTIGKNPYDNAWHHLAGVVTASEMRVYFDGSSLTCAQTLPIYYPTPRADIWVGRHASGTSDIRDYEGGLDEIRVYTRALSPAEIARLASGKP